MTFVGSDGHTAEARHIEHQASIAGRVSGIAVASATDGDRQMIGGCEAQGGLDVLGVSWTHYQCGMRGKLGCIALAKLLVLRVSRRKIVPVSLRARAARLVSLGIETGIAAIC